MVVYQYIMQNNNMLTEFKVYAWGSDFLWHYFKDIFLKCYSIKLNNNISYIYNFSHFFMIHISKCLIL